MKLTLFEFAILLHPKKEDKDNKTDEKTVLVVPPTPYLAKDSNAVALYAAKQIPQEYDDQLDNIEIVVKKW
jgi:hypothetical protein